MLKSKDQTIERQTEMRRTPGLSTALVIVVLSLLAGGRSAGAQAHPWLEYKGGPVLATFKIYSLYWGQWTPAQIKAQQEYLTGLAAYISGVGAPTGEVPMLTQYGVYKASVATKVVTANPGAKKDLSQTDIVNIIKNNAGKLPAFDAHTLIMVFLGKGSSLTVGKGMGYHHSESNTAFWAAVPQNAGPTLARVTAHEVFEAATDPGDDNSQGSISHHGQESNDGCNSPITLPWHNSSPETDDNWNMKSVGVTVKGSGGSSCVLDQKGTPLRRLTGSSPSVTLYRGKGC